MVEDSLFDDADDTLPREKIIQKFQQWWTAEQIEEILKDHNITSPAFLANIKQMQNLEHFELDHLQYATILYEQVGEKFLFSEKEKRYSFLAKILKAVVDPIIGQPSLEQEINRLFKQEWELNSIPRYADEDDLRKFLHTLHTFFSTKKPFLRELPFP